MMALLGAPLIRKYFGQLAPISAAGVNSMDVLLPSITRYSGKDMIPLAIFHGILIDMSVPVSYPSSVIYKKEKPADWLSGLLFHI